MKGVHFCGRVPSSGHRLRRRRRRRRRRSTHLGDVLGAGIVAAGAAAASRGQPAADKAEPSQKPAAGELGSRGDGGQTGGQSGGYHHARGRPPSPKMILPRRWDIRTVTAASAKTSQSPSRSPARRPPDSGQNIALLR